MSEILQKMAADTAMPKRSRAMRLLALALVLLFLTAAFVLSRYLLLTRPQVRRQAPAKMETMVEVMAVTPTSQTVTIEAHGRVVPAREISLKARVPGRVVYLHPDFIPGGVIREGEVLLRLDRIDYDLELRRADDALALAEADLRLEEGSQEVARQEWNLITALTDDLETTSLDLALRKPQLAKAEAQVKSARTLRERARVDLDRTVIRAPFDLVVREESIDLGSEILTSTPIATLAAIDLFWAEISVPVAKLAWFELPSQDRKGALVELYGREPLPYSGRIVALAPDLDKDGLMARLLIAVDDPLGLKNGRSPLLLGSFVRAVIKGATLDRVYRLPRSVLSENDILMLADSEDKLRFQPVEIVWRGLREVFVGSGLQPEDRVIISKLAAPLDGMPLKVRPPRTATDDHEAGKVKEAGAAHDSTEKP